MVVKAFVDAHKTFVFRVLLLLLFYFVPFIVYQYFVKKSPFVSKYDSFGIVKAFGFEGLLTVFILIEGRM